MSPYLKVVQELFNSYNLTPEDIDLMKKSDATNILWTVITNTGYKGRPIEISQLKDKRGQHFRKRGKSISRKIYSAATTMDRNIWLVLIELGGVPLRSQETRMLSKRVSDTLFKQAPRYEKIERSDTRNNKVHLHAIVVLPDDFSFPMLHCGFRVKYKKLGHEKEYKSIALEHQVEKFVKYLMKPGDSRSNCKRRDLRMQVYYEWFLEQWLAAEQPTQRNTVRLSRCVGLTRL